MVIIDIINLFQVHDVANKLKSSAPVHHNLANEGRPVVVCDESDSPLASSDVHLDIAFNASGNMLNKPLISRAEQDNPK